jgi:hypothetical protein
MMVHTGSAGYTGVVGLLHEWVTARRCPFFENYFLEKFEKIKSVFLKIERKFTTQFVLSNHFFGARWPNVEAGNSKIWVFGGHFI